METWKAIPGYEGYEASDLGRVRSLIFGVRGDPRRPRKKPYVLKPGTDKDGYHKYTLSIDGKLHYKRGHCLVLEAFVGPAPEGHIGCHGDGKVDNNRLSNIRWDTYSANSLDRRKHGTVPYKYVSRHTKLNQFAVYAMREQVYYGELQKDVAKLWGIRSSHLGAIVRGEKWKWVGGPINRSNRKPRSNNEQGVQID